MNGPVRVTIDPRDGTKTRETPDNTSLIDLQFPESVDLKITNKCYQACKYCHESSTPSAPHGELNLSYFKNLPKGTELAIGGGNPLLHPDLRPFLEGMKKQGVLCSITVHEKDVNQALQQLIKDELVHGIGISGIMPQPELYKITNNVVHHVIAGHHCIKKVIQANLPKVLVLGYKSLGRGEAYASTLSKLVIMGWWMDTVTLMGSTQTSFDNLAITQLGVKNLVSKKAYKQRYMGDEGDHTFYVDLVTGTFAKSSTDKVNSFTMSKDIVKDFKSIKH